MIKLKTLIDTILVAFMDESLLWTIRIHYQCLIISSKNSLLNQLLSFMLKEIQQMFCQDIHFHWFNTWDTNSRMNAEWLSKIQNTKIDFNMPSVEMLSEPRCSYIPCRLDYNKAVFINKTKTINNVTRAHIVDILNLCRNIKSTNNESISTKIKNSSLWRRFPVGTEFWKFNATLRVD